MRECCSLALMLSRQRLQHLSFAHETVAAARESECAGIARLEDMLEEVVGGVEETLKELDVAGQGVCKEKLWLQAVGRKLQQEVEEEAEEMQVLQSKMSLALLWASPEEGDPGRRVA